MQTLTLEDIADQCDVSRSTVSRVINNHPNVSEKVRKRVLKVIKKTGYQPHAAARTLVSQRSWTIGLVLPRTINSFFTDPYYPSLIQGIAHACNQHNYTFSLFLMEDQEDEEKIYPRISRRGFLDGILFQSDQIGDLLIDQLVASGIPLVVIGRPFHNENISYIDINNTEAVESAIDYLIQCGHKNIGTIAGPLNTTVGIDRKTGYLNSLRKHGYTVRDSLIVEGTFTEDSGYRGMQNLLSEKPDAIFAASDLMARGAMRAIKENGLEIPEDIAVIGFDDFPLSTPTKPTLSTIRQPIRNFGKKAIELLNDLIENGPDPSRHVILDTELILRESSRQL